MSQTVPPTNRAPRARTEGLVTTQAGKDFFVYDTESHHVHQLNATAMAVWQLCDGVRTEDEISRSVTAEVGEAVSVESVRLALLKLSDATLLDGPDESTGMSRRSLMRKAAVAGAIAVPVVVSTTAPASAMPDSDWCDYGCTGWRTIVSFIPWQTVWNDSCQNTGVEHPDRCNRCNGTGLFPNWYIEGTCVAPEGARLAVSKGNDYDTYFLSLSLEEQIAELKNGGVSQDEIDKYVAAQSGKTTKSQNKQQSAADEQETEATPTEVSPTPEPTPTEVPPTPEPPTQVPPTQVPPTQVPPTQPPPDTSQGQGNIETTSLETSELPEQTETEDEQ